MIPTNYADAIIKQKKTKTEYLRGLSVSCLSLVN